MFYNSCLSIRFLQKLAIIKKFISSKVHKVINECLMEKNLNSSKIKSTVKILVIIRRGGEGGMNCNGGK